MATRHVVTGERRGDTKKRSFRNTADIVPEVAPRAAINAPTGQPPLA